MIHGTGCDIIEISRIRASITRHEKHFLDKVFTPFEQEYCLKFQDSAPHFAARFAAKEAVVKALGIGFRKGISFLDIEVRNDQFGRPQIFLSLKLKEMFNHPQILISISHCREYAVAFANYL